MLANGILKTVLHHADCPSAHLAVPATSLCLGRFWKPMEVNTVADKFWYMLTRTGATCLKLCRAESLEYTDIIWLARWIFRASLQIAFATACTLHRASQKAE